MITVSPHLNRLPADERGITLADFLVPIRVGERMGSRLRHIALVTVGALFIALTAQITIVQDGQTIPLIADYQIRLATTPVPITGQTFGVLLVGGALGLRRGFLAVALYLVGVPWIAFLVVPPELAAERWQTAAAWGLTPFVIVDAIKLILAALAFPAAWWIVGRRAGEG